MALMVVVLGLFVGAGCHPEGRRQMGSRSGWGGKMPSFEYRDGKLTELPDVIVDQDRTVSEVISSTVIVRRGSPSTPVPLVGIMEFILVLQWPATSEADYDALIAMEDALETDLAEAHGYVDGHDFGSGEMNLFVHTDLPLDAFRDAEVSLGADSRWAAVRAAYRPTDGDEYTVVWPATLQDFSVS